MNREFVTTAPAIDAFQHVFSRLKRGYGDNQLRQISQRGIEQSADRIAGLFCNTFGCVTEESGKRHDSQDGEHE